MQQPQEADDARGATLDDAPPSALRGLMPLSDKDFPVAEHTLPNGLQIRLLEDRSLPVCTVYSFFRVGSRNERPGITGISHLFEHMMFNGSRKYGPKEFDRRLEAAGGSSNAYTSQDLTAYYEDFASEALPALTYLAHPYRWPVIGWMSDIEAITRQDCESYFRTYYAPNNCTLVLVGDFDTAAAMREVQRLYGGIPAGGPRPEVPTGEPAQKGERRAEVRYPSQAPSLLAGFRGPSGADADSLVLDLIETALSAG